MTYGPWRWLSLGRSLIWFRSALPLTYSGFGLMLHTGILVTINIPIFRELHGVGYLASDPDGASPPC